MDATPESSPEAAAPARPAAVPPTGVWNAEVGRWEVAQTDARGVRDGECLHYRDDGRLFARFRFVAGVQDGPFALYHRGGNVFREGTYVAGQLDGTVTSYASDDPDGEPLRRCCVPAGAARLCERYRAGEFLLEIFYDRQGRAILSDGRLCPPRPDGLPELAQFDESRGGWSLRSRDVDRFWTVEGALTEEVEHGREGAHVDRRFDVDGRLLQECGFTANNQPDGPFYRRFSEKEPSPYADTRIRQERGAYQAGQPIGRWTFLDGAGEILRAADRGAAFGDDAEARAALLANAGGDWWTRARTLAEAGRVREALVAAARAAVAAGDRAALEQFRDAHVVALAADRAAQWGDALAQATDATAMSILDGLVCGADAAAAFRALASVLPATDAAATDLVEASMLLAPEQRMTHLTRALLRFQRGDQAGALADADVLADESAEAAASLRSYVTIVFRGFGGWPVPDTFAPDPEVDGIPLEIGHDVAEIRHVVGVYATRLGRARAAIRTLLAGGASPAWVPPDLSALLPTGAVPLRRETVRCEDDETVEIDEELATESAGVPTLLTAAHADWAALSWLCWAVGQAQVALPDAVAPPADLAVAMKMFVQRTWRIKDRLASGSLISRSQGVPGFEWQGVDIDALPRHLAEMAAAEYVAVRSMFLWLVSADAESPFQDDLRDA